MPAGYDVFHMGRCSIDLYSDDIGAPFAEISRFSAYVGGSPTNISVGARRLGLRTALLTAVGDDPVGEFILRFLREEGVVTDHIPIKIGRRTPAVLLGIEPPDRFPLVYYRENCADGDLTIEDVPTEDVAGSRVFQFAGTNLSLEPSRSATVFAAEVARKAGRTVLFDLDLRADQWPDVRYFGAAARDTMRVVDVVVGTGDELRGAVAASASDATVTHSQVSDARVAGDTNAAVEAILALGPSVVIEKVGEKGARVHEKTSSGVRVEEADGFPVEVVNVLGAGDAFGAGLIYGHVQGWSWSKAARLGNACGAIVVTRHGCANFMPTLPEALEIADRYGGL